MTTGSGYGFRARGLRPRPGMTSQNLRGLVLFVLQRDRCAIRRTLLAGAAEMPAQTAAVEAAQIEACRMAGFAPLSPGYGAYQLAGVETATLPEGWTSSSRASVVATAA